MRKAGLGRLLRLALLLEGSRVGLTLAGMAEALEVSPRTVQRMLAVLEAELPHLERLGEAVGVLRWRLPRGATGALGPVTAEEQAALGQAGSPGARATAMWRGGSTRSPPSCPCGSTRPARAASPPTPRRCSRPRAWPIARAERVDEGVLDAPGQAILAGRWIEADHRAKASGLLGRGQRLGPVALLLGGGRRCLLAFQAYPDALRLYALPGFEAVRVSVEPFEWPAGFDLDAWLAGSVGTRREASQDVAWRLAPEAEAEAWLFHPGQVSGREADGSLVVRSRAGGSREVAWHLVQWGDRVEAPGPPRLREELRAHATAVLERHGDAP